MAWSKVQIVAVLVVGIWGAVPADASPLEVGSEVLLYNLEHKRLVRMRASDGFADGGGQMTQEAAAAIPADWTWERFRVVDAGQGRVALYSDVSRLFLRTTPSGELDGGQRLDALASRKNWYELPSSWTWEQFEVVDVGGGAIALYNPSVGRFVRMKAPAADGKVDCDGTPSSSPILPAAWTYERFKVIVTRRGAVASERPVSALPVTASHIFGVGDHIFAVGADDVVTQQTLAAQVQYQPRPDKIACWDWNHNGLGEPGEDQNGDGFFNDLDCDRCWDKNRNGVDDAAEDVPSWITSERQCDNSGPGGRPACRIVELMKADGRFDRNDCTFKCFDADFDRTLDSGEMKPGASLEPYTSAMQHCMSRGLPSSATWSSATLGKIPAPQTVSAGLDIVRAFGDGGALYLVDAGGALWLTGLAQLDPRGTSGGGDGWRVPVKIDGTTDWRTFSQLIGDWSGLIYGVEQSTGTLFFFKYRSSDKTWPVYKDSVGTSFGPIAGGVGGEIFALKGADLFRYVDAAQDGTALPAGVKVAAGLPSASAIVVAGSRLLLFAGTAISRIDVPRVGPPPLTVGSNAGSPEICVAGKLICLRVTAGQTGAITASGAYVRASGAITLVTPAGSWPMGNATLDVALVADRPHIAGTASIGLPPVGILKDSVSLISGATAQIAIGFGGSFEARIGDGADEKTFPTNPSKFYLYARFSGDIKVRIFGSDVTLAAASSKLLFEPTTPIFYTDGALAKILINTLSFNYLMWWQNPVIGFSLGECIPHSLSRPLPRATITTASGVTTVTRSPSDPTEMVTVCGNVVVKGSGTIPLEPVGIPAEIDIAAGMVLDFDADNDGKLVWQTGETRTDFALGADLDLTVKMSIKNIPVNVPTQYTLYFEGPPGSKGRLRLAGLIGNENIFAGTFLEPWKTSVGSLSASADVLLGEVGRPMPPGSTPEWVRLTRDSMAVAGWQLGTASLTITREMLEATGRLELVPGTTLSVTGRQRFDGSETFLQGTGTITLAGVTLADASISTTNFTNLTVSGRIGFGSTQATMTGTYTSPSSFDLTGTASGSVSGSWTDASGNTWTASVNGTADLRITPSGGSYRMSAKGNLKNSVTDFGTVDFSATVSSDGYIKFTHPLDPAQHEYVLRVLR